MTTTNGFLSMGLSTYQVPVEEFAAHRNKLLDSLPPSLLTRGGIIVLQGGDFETRFDSDHEPLFRQESYFWYLTGVKEPDCSLLIDISTRTTTLFVPKLPPEYATVMGAIKTCEEWKQIYRVDHVKYTEELSSDAKQKLKQRNGQKPKLYVLQGRNSDSGLDYQPPFKLLDELDASQVVDTTTLFPHLAECRVIKTATELLLLQHVTEVTSWAHAYVMRNTRVHMMEYQAESLFRHYCHYNYGCRLVGYTPICGCGPNAAILHYGHAGEPNGRQIQDGDMCLFDMGAEYCHYGSDVTCSFPANGKFTKSQRAIYTAVLEAQISVYDMVKPGVSWVDCHKAAEATILQHLIALGIVIPHDKTVPELVAMRLGAVFMPHGLGHFIGIDTHDVGGYGDGHPERSPLPGLQSLRTSRVLQVNMTLTVEPGCYFIDHLLDSALADASSLRRYMNREKLQSFRGFGGVRLEDVVVVTETGCINYTLCPRTVDEVEAVMAGAPWPPRKDVAQQLRRERLTEPNPLPLPAPPSR